MSKRWYSLITSALDWIPLSIGMKLRSLGYKTVFSYIDSTVQIEKNIFLTRPYRIGIKRNSFIKSGVNLEVCSDENSIYIGEKVILDLGVSIKAHPGKGNIIIGDFTSIGPYACLSGREISVGKNCMIASHCGIYANNHIFADTEVPMKHQGRSYKGITIEDDCWLGTGVKILDGVTVGKGSVIGAGSVILKDIPEYSVVVGVPGKIIKSRR